MYPQFKQLNLVEIDKAILEFWSKEQIFQRSISERQTAPAWVFYEGPPSANGLPGIHHVLARTIKDIFCRFHTLKGYKVERKGGWDTHGLPIELGVEKQLGIRKDDIGTEKISIAEYNQHCRTSVMRYKDIWDDITQKMGYWVDLKNPYITFETDYIESVWNLLKKLYDKGLLYKGYSIQPYSPAAGTGLSTHELNMPGAYQEVKDTTIVAMFKVIPNERSAFLFEDNQEDVRLLAWTTTPWTLPSNTALAVGKNIDYIKIKTLNPYTQAPVSVILAKKLADKWLGEKIVRLGVSEDIKGDALENIRYEQLLAYEQPTDGDAFRVIIGDFVSTEDGTGIVHIAPSFGADDRRVATKNGIGTLTLVDKSGKFLDTVHDFAGRYVKDYRNEGEHYKEVDVDIAIKLKTEGKAFNVQKYAHNYPHCWRTNKPILYYPLDSWFIKTTAAKDRMVELNKTIRWKPESTGTGRFGNWLENLQDWNLSRSRYWGVPLPIWRNKEATKEICIGSLEELSREIAKANQVLHKTQTVPTDLHRPYTDEIVLVSEDGEALYREEDLIDVWFDSGAMPYAQWHYPFENQEKFAQAFPADFIAEGVDQTRGWFFTLHAIAVMCFDSVAFKSVVSNGLVLDKNGEKMSKSKGNVVDPFEMIGKYGADAVRWYMITNAAPWDNLKFDEEGIKDVQRKFFGTLYNTYSFFALYANVDDFSIDEMNIIPVQERSELDRWIISKLHSLIQEVSADLENYEPSRAGRRMEEFVGEHLSNWYIRLSRRRFWKGTMTADKKAAYETLYECLNVVGQLMSPIAPFFAEWLFKNLTDGVRSAAKALNTPLQYDSVHLTYLTKSDTSLIDSSLEYRMEMAQRLCSMVLAIRKKEKIRVRQPLQKILVPILNQKFQEEVELVKNLILAEVNVKELEYVADTTGIIKKSIKPNFKTLGKTLGKNMKAAQELINNFTQEDIGLLEKNKSYTLQIGEDTYTLNIEDFLISSQDMEGWLVMTDGELTVALDSTLNDLLRAEGIAREIVNRIQGLRKEYDFDLTDRILVSIEKQDLTESAILHFKKYISDEVLAKELYLVDTLETGEAVDLVEDITCKIAITKVV